MTSTQNIFCNKYHKWIQEPFLPIVKGLQLHLRCDWVSGFSSNYKQYISNYLSFYLFIYLSIYLPIYIYIYNIKTYRKVTWSDYPILGVEIARARKCFQHPLLTSKPATMTEYSDQHPSLSIIRSKGLRSSKMKW